MATRKLKIIFFCAGPAFGLDSNNVLQVGGIENANLNLCKELAKRGHTIVLESPTDRTVTHGNLLNRPLQKLGEARDEVFDLAISSNDTRYLRTVNAQQKVLWLHNPINAEKAFRKKQLFDYFQLKPHLVVLGQYHYAVTSKLYPFRSRTIIPYGIDGMFHGISPSATTRQQKFVWASQPQRGLEMTMRMWLDHLQPIAPKAEFHIFGADENQAKFPSSQMASQGVRFHGRVDRPVLLQAYRDATAMIYPGAHDETFCLAVVEANALGLPIISRARGCLAERIHHGVNGFVSDSDAQLAGYAVRLLNSDGLRRQMEEGSRLSAIPYHWQRAADLWESTFENWLSH